MKLSVISLYVVGVIFSVFTLVSSAQESYCRSEGSSTVYEWIESFTINDSEFLSGNNNGYFEHVNGLPVLRPGSNNLVLTPGYPSTSYNEKWRGWLDLNNDNQFSQDEKVFEAEGQNALALNFDLPATVEAGMATLRIAMRYGVFPDPCGTYPYGEAEDIVVSIETDSSSSYSHNLTLAYDFTVVRDGSIGEDVTWVVEKDNEVVLQRNASGELEYKYFSNTVGSNIRVWLNQFIDGEYQRISNIVEYVPGITNRFELDLGNNFELSRSGVLGDSVQWVIEKDGNIVLQRNAENELSYTYFSNTNGSKFRVWLQQFIDGEYKIVSNTILYEVGQSEFALSVDQQFNITRNGQPGDDVNWVIEEDGNIVLRRNAEDELQYAYFSNKPGSSYRAWLEKFVNGHYETVSNVVEYAVPASFPYEIQLGPNYEVSRSGSIGDPVSWLVKKNGAVVLQRNAANELSYTYFSNTVGSTIEVYLVQFINGFYQPVSNTVEYTVQ